LIENGELSRSVFITRFGELRFVAKGSVLHLVEAAVAFLGTVAFVGPSGDFPLNDDWAYAFATRTLLATGTWQPTTWPAMPHISNALWAAPICAASTCSFDDLRLTTLLASLVLLSATFFLLSLTKRESAVLLVAMVLVTFNPIAYALSFTFMTDILFSALITISALLYIISLKRDSVLLVVFGTIVALAATLSRQLGLCVPLAYFVVRLMTAKSGQKLIPALVPLLLCTVSLVLLDGWLWLIDRTPAHSAEIGMVSILTSPISAMLRVWLNLVTVLLYAGLFCLPLLLLTRPPAVTEVPSSLRRLPFSIAAGAVVLIIIGVVARRQIMPFGRNILIPQGIGPLTLRDTYILGLPDVPSLPLLFWVVVTLLSVWGAFELTERVAIFAVGLLTARKSGRLDPVDTGVLFAAAAVLAYFTPLMLIPIYDRYIIPMLPLTLFFLTNASLTRSTGYLRAAGTVLCLSMAVFAVLAAHDYMAWNRARWSAIADIQKVVSAGPSNLDGGFEYNALFSYNPSYHQRGDKSWWWIDDDTFQITFGPIDAMQIVGRYPYETLLPPANRAILVLHK
jgi:hypothetical protein